jgi:hypothetical protein
MNELRRFLGWIFGLLAFIIAPTVIFAIVKSPLHRPVWAASMLIFAALYAIACWTVLTHKPTGRIFGLICSALPLLALSFIYYRHDYRVSGLSWVIIGTAVAGFVAFFPRNATRLPQDHIAAPSPVAGDGTHRFINKSVVVVGTLAFLFGINALWHWGVHQGLSPGGRLFLLQIVAADIFVVLMHELGHALTGLALGMKMRAFLVGPFQWQIRHGKWTFKFRPAAFLVSGGAAALVPTKPSQRPWRYVCMVAAGPFVSLILGVIALWALFAAPDSSWESAWLFLACVASISLLAAVLNLVPFQTGTMYSDGAYIYQLLSGGPWGDLHHAFSIAASTLISSLRPRDYDIAAIERASKSITCGHRALQLRLMASSYYLDCGKFPEATQSLTEAEAIYHESASYIPTEMYPWFIFRKALLQRDAAGARVWWNNMAAKKQLSPDANYWLAQSALFWIENRIGEAREAWEKGNDLAQKLPKCGDTEFARYRLAMLRDAIDKPAGRTALLQREQPNTGSVYQPA